VCDCEAMCQCTCTHTHSVCDCEAMCQSTCTHAHSVCDCEAMCQSTCTHAHSVCDCEAMCQSRHRPEEMAGPCQRFWRQHFEVLCIWALLGSCSCRFYLCHMVTGSHLPWEHTWHRQVSIVNRQGHGFWDDLGIVPSLSILTNPE
jgi:hypothetical protein